MKKYFAIFTIILFSFTCSQKKFQKDFSDWNLFPDGFAQTKGLKFFDLLDSFPTLKTALKSVNINDFNNRLNKALQEIHPVDINGSLRATQYLLLDAKPTLQSTLQVLNSVIYRLRTGNPASRSHSFFW